MARYKKVRCDILVAEHTYQAMRELGGTKWHVELCLIEQQ